MTPAGASLVLTTAEVQEPRGRVSWSSDGKEIAFVSDVDDGIQIWSLPLLNGVHIGMSGSTFFARKELEKFGVVSSHINKAVCQLSEYMCGRC